MVEILEQVLAEFIGEEFYLQGTMDPDEKYPETFATYFISSSGFEAFYDDDPNRVDQYVAVIYYTNDPDKLQSEPPKIIRELRKAGFIPTNAGINVISDVKTHNGFAMDFVYPSYQSI